MRWTPSRLATDHLRRPSNQPSYPTMHGIQPAKGEPMKQRALATLAVALAAGLTLAGCGGPKPTTGDAGQSASGGKDPYAPVKVAEGFTTKGGNVNVLMSSDFQTLDP